MKRTAIVICALISLGVAGPASASSKPTPAQSQVAQRSPDEIGEAAPRPAGPQASQSYAAREQAVPQLADFKGGDGGGLYIGGSTVAVVLLIVLLIVLL